MLLQLGVTNDNKSTGRERPDARPDQPHRHWRAARRWCPATASSVIANSPAFVKMKPNLGAFPFSGDIVVIQSEPYKQSDEHVFVFLNKISDTAWDTGESGQGPPPIAKNGVIEAKRKSRAMRISANSMIAAAAERQTGPQGSRAGSTSRNWITWRDRCPEPLSATAGRPSLNSRCAGGNVTLRHDSSRAALGKPLQRGA